jgi:hypothetical protein
LSARRPRSVYSGMPSTDSIRSTKRDDT